jgi:hypothetical protein
MSNEITVREHAEIAADSKTTARVVESMVLRGDISALSPEERAKFYIQMCASLGLSAASQPFAVLRLNGKDLLYPTRGATDQLAAIHKLNRRIIDGPRVIDLAGTKLVFAVCEATHPNGRVETATATVPLTDPVNVLMKCETKAKRRATLSILGLGMLDETEVETIPARTREDRTPTADELRDAEREPSAIDRELAEAQAEAKYQGGPSAPQAPAAEGRDPRTAPSFVALLDALDAARDTDGVVAAWLAHGARLAQDGSDVLEVGRADTYAAWTANGGAPSESDLRAAIDKARAAKHAAEQSDTKARSKSRKTAAAPLAKSVDVPTPAQWDAQIGRDNDAGHIAGGYHKRAELWRECGELARVRAITVDRLNALLGRDESEAAAWLDGCDPVRRSERRASLTERRPAR